MCGFERMAVYPGARFISAGGYHHHWHECMGGTACQTGDRGRFAVIVVRSGVV